jgi:hypothetical protein
MSNQNPQHLEKNTNVNLVALLGIVTLFFYLVHFYKKTVEKLNIMTRTAFGRNAKKVKFSAGYVYTAFVLLLAPFVAIFVVILSAITGFDTWLLNFAFNPIPSEVFFAAAAVIAISDIILVVYLLRLLRDIRAQVIELALYYRRYDIAKDFTKKSSMLSPGGDEGKVLVAFNKLIDEHNSHIGGYRTYA